MTDMQNLDFMSSMDMELSKTSFPYFFKNVLGMMYPEYMKLYNKPPGEFKKLYRRGFSKAN